MDDETMLEIANYKDRIVEADFVLVGIGEEFKPNLMERERLMSVFRHY
ncbi:MAG: hypothetical protein R3Y54_04180 [Eubacteriales bacterium]